MLKIFACFAACEFSIKFYSKQSEHVKHSALLCFCKLDQNHFDISENAHRKMYQKCVSNNSGLQNK